MNINGLLERNQRIAALPWGIWKAGIPAMSWAWQCGPEWPVHPAEQDFFIAGVNAARQLEHDTALAAEMERARAILASQGKVLAGPEETALLQHLMSNPELQA